MKATIHNIIMSQRNFGGHRTNILLEYPLYPSSDDIFSKLKKETEINPEDITKTKESNDITGELNEKDFYDDVTGGDLDFYFSELDDVQKNAGVEDEENSLFSIGGDDHNNLDEYQGV